MPQNMAVTGSTAPAARPGASAVERAATQGVYGIGAVAAMVDVPTTTLRNWELRYKIVVPERARTGHRLYSRRHVEQLRFVVSEIERGSSAADAHRALTQRVSIEAGGADRESGRPPVLILVAERDQYGAERIELLLREQGFGVEIARGADDAKARFDASSPDLVILEFLLDGGSGEDLSRWFKERSTTPVLVLSGLAAPGRAVRAGADAFLLKPVSAPELIAAVTDLLGLAAVLDRHG